MKLLKVVLKILIVFAIIALAIWAKQSGFFEMILKVIQNLGIWAVPAFLAIYILSCLLFFPSAIMTCAAGILFPVPLAILLSLLGTSMGSTLALLIGRYGMRDSIKKAADRNPQFQKLDAAIEREGWKIVTLARLAPVFPFSIGNYLFGASSIPAWIYAITAFIGTIPSAAVYVWIGHMTGQVSGAHARTPLEWILLGIGIVATIVLSVYLKKFFSRIMSHSDTSKI